MALNFTAPIDFAEALASRRVRSLLPTRMSSRDLSRIAPELLERGVFSARTVNASYLQEIDDLVQKVANGQIDIPSVRLALKEKLDATGYTPDPEERGTIKDLRSDQRLNLVIKTNTEMAQGYGWWAQGQDQTVLDEFPCQELFRLEERVQPRDWLTRWRGAGGRVFGGGRMIAEKNAPIWAEISSFGLPYPPFDFGSGMDVRDIARDEAIALGVIKSDTRVTPQDRGFNDELQATPSVRSNALRAILEEDGYTFNGDILIP